MQQEILQLRAETKAINIVDEQTLICVKTEDMAIDEHLKSVELEVASLLQFLEALEEENKELDKEIGTTQQK